MKIKSPVNKLNNSPVNPDIRNASSLGAVLALCFGAAFFIVLIAAATCYFYQRKTNDKHNHKTLLLKNHPSKTLPLKKPTAIKSPCSGQPLKKSPSPTGTKSFINNPKGGQQKSSPTNEQNNQVNEITVKEQIDQTSSQNLNAKSQIKEKETKIKYEELGKFHFKLKYNYEKRALCVSIIKCVDLPHKDSNKGNCDPYVKLQLLPDKQHKVKTRVLRKTQNPIYDEDFTFYGINPNQLQEITLHFIILSFDKYSRDDVIGEVFCQLNHFEFDTLEKQIFMVKDICSRSHNLKLENHGEILASLCYQPAAHRLTVVVLKAKNLPRMDITGLCDPYVKIYLFYNNQRVTKKRTHVKKRTLNPVFNESFVFDIPYNEGLDNVSLHFHVLDYDRITKNETIGKVELGLKGSPSAQKHWQEVAASPRKQIADWHKLTI